MLSSLNNSMLIGSCQRIANKTLNVTVWGKVLTQVGSVCYLGVTIDLSLSWNLQVSNVVSRVRSWVASLLQFGSLSPVILRALYTAFVLPLYDYCDVVWSPIQLQSSLVCWKGYILSLLENCHHPVPQSCLLCWLNVDAIIQQFKYSGLYTIILLHIC